jgi:sulfur carrier protein
MRIEVNGEPLEMADAVRVADVVERVTGSRTPEGVAVARNGEIVRRAEWGDAPVGAGDRFEIVSATAGG